MKPKTDTEEIYLLAIEESIISILKMLSVDDIKYLLPRIHSWIKYNEERINRK